MLRIGVLATRRADQRLIREHIAGLFAALPDDASWNFHYCTSFARFRDALTAGELQLGLLVRTSDVAPTAALLALAQSRALVLVSDLPPPSTLRTIAQLPIAGLGPALLQRVLRSALRLAELNATLRHLNDHDGGTGLLLEASFTRLLDVRLDAVPANAGTTTRPPVRHALLCLRLDGFGELETGLGMASAERVLRLAAARMQARLRDGELLCRGDGAEFFAWLRCGVRVERAAQRLQQCFEAPFELTESSAYVRASVGIVAVLQRPATDEPAVTLLRQARAAADVVLTRTGARTLRYDSNIERDARRAQLRNALDGALARDEFDVFYQPIVSVQHGNVVGAEALLRWHGQAIGSVSPAHFIPIAEDSGAILSIGQWVLRRACQDAVLWLDRFWTQVRIAVNVSPAQIRSGRLTEQLQLLLHELPLHPRQLELEIGEANYLALAQTQYPLIEHLRDQGFVIVLDEFGSSYAPLDYLQRWPVDVLKIDRNLISTLATPSADPQLVRGIVAMGAGLGLRVVAVGVETEAQLAQLREFGCAEAQGYLLGAPMPGDEFIARLLHRPPLDGTQPNIARSA